MTRPVRIPRGFDRRKAASAPNIEYDFVAIPRMAIEEAAHPALLAEVARPHHPSRCRKKRYGGGYQANRGHYTKVL
jgi:hypothetical protein